MDPEKLPLKRLKTDKLPDDADYGLVDPLAGDDGHDNSLLPNSHSSSSSGNQPSPINSPAVQISAFSAIRVDPHSDPSKIKIDKGDVQLPKASQNGPAITSFEHQASIYPTPQTGSFQGDAAFELPPLQFRQTPSGSDQGKSSFHINMIAPSFPLDCFILLSMILFLSLYFLFLLVFPSFFSAARFFISFCASFHHSYVNEICENKQLRLLHSRISMRYTATWISALLLNFHLLASDLRVISKTIQIIIVLLCSMILFSMNFLEIKKRIFLYLISLSSLLPKGLKLRLTGPCKMKSMQLT